MKTPREFTLDSNLVHTQRCKANHFGFWMIEELWFSQAVAAIQAGTYRPVRGFSVEDVSRWFQVPQDKLEAVHEVTDSGAPAAFHMAAEGVAVLNMMGPMMIEESKFGGVSTASMRESLRQVAASPEISALILHVDSPGGTVAGTNELAEEVRATRETTKVVAHISNTGASAALWVASQTERITAGPTAEVGSIGTVAVIEDSSGLADAAGIKVHVISTGEHKGAGTPGTKITDEQLAHFQTRVDDLNGHFLRAIAEGRGMGMETVKALADGRMHIAEKAQGLGLIDEVTDFGAVVESLAAEVGLDRRRRAQEQRMRQL